MLAANARIAAAAAAARPRSPSTPSGMVPVYQKPPATAAAEEAGGQGRPRRLPAQDAGRRSTPASSIAWRPAPAAAENCNAATAPARGSSRTSPRRSRRSSPSTRSTATTAPRARSTSSRWCPTRCPTPRWATTWSPCPVGSTTAWASRIGQVRDILGGHLHTESPPAGLLDGWQRLAEALFPWYEQIGRRGSGRRRACTPTRPAGGSMARPTGSGAFATTDCCYYLIDQSRAAPRPCRSSSSRRSRARWSRLLGRLRLGLRRRPPEVPAAPAAGTAQGRRAQRQPRVEGLQQTTQAAGPRRHPPAQAARLHARALRLAHRR